MNSIAYNEDCMIGMARYPDNHFDLAVVDPPYGLNLALNGQFKKYGGSSKWDIKPSDKYVSELFRISEHQVIWGYNYISDLLPPCRGFIYWNKMNHHDNRSDGELAWVSFDGLSRHFEYMWDGNRYGKRGNIKGVGLPSVRIHPTEKPIALYDWIYKNYLPDGGKVIDTHLGSGSNRIAAHKAGNIDFTGFELDTEYYEAAEKRYKEFISQLTLF